MTLYMTLAQYLKTVNSTSAVDAAEEQDIYDIIEEASRLLDQHTRRTLYERIETREYSPRSVQDDGQVYLRDLVLDESLLSTDPTILKSGATDPVDGDYIQLRPVNGAYASVIRLIGEDSSWMDYYDSSLVPIQITGVWGYSLNSWYQVGVLSAGVDADDTTFQFSTSTGVEKFQTLRIGTEYVKVTGISTNNLIVERGVNGSTGAVHAISTIVYAFKPAPMIRRAMKRIIKWWAEQEKAPLMDVVQAGDVAIPVSTSKMPQDLKDMISTMRFASTFDKA